MAKAQHYIGGGTPYRNSVNWKGGTPTILSKWGNNWGEKKHILGGGTPHILH